MTEEIIKLEEAYNKLKTVPRFSSFFKKVYKTDSNIMFEYAAGDDNNLNMFSLYDDPRISISKASFKKGSHVNTHIHPNAYNIFLILSGEISIEYENDVKIIKSLEYYIVDKDVPHSVSAVEDTEFIAITIPRDEGYPTTTITG